MRKDVVTIAKIGRMRAPRTQTDPRRRIADASSAAGLAIRGRGEGAPPPPHLLVLPLHLLSLLLNGPTFHLLRNRSPDLRPQAPRRGGPRPAEDPARSTARPAVQVLPT